MQICKNKDSGKYFIYIEDEGNGKTSLVLPTGEIKSLKLSLFEEPEQGNEKDFLSHGFITDRQVKEYRAEVKRRAKTEKIESREAALRAFEDLPYKEQVKKSLEILEKLSPDKKREVVEKIKQQLLDE